MERSFAARVARPLGLPGVRGGGGRGRASARSLPGLPFAARLRSAASFIWRRRGTRIALVAVLVGLPVLGGGFLLLRNSSFVAVEHVEVSGVHGAEAAAIEAALGGAARHMSTLDIHRGALLAAVAPFRVVSSLRVRPSFPHSLRIDVSEELPVASLLVNGLRTAVAADGMVLGPALLSSRLPTLTGYIEPAAGERLHSPFLLESLAVLGAAPQVLVRHVAKLYIASEGLTVAMRNGLLVYFGDDTRPHAKWLSLARVLADHSSAGATYVDVRLPGRPAAGGFPAGEGPAASTTTSEEPLSSSEPSSSSSPESTVGALAAGLSKESGASARTPATVPSESSSEPAATGGEASEAQSSTTSSETPSEGATAGG